MPIHIYEGHTIEGRQITYGAFDPKVDRVDPAKGAHWSSPIPPPPVGTIIEPFAFYRGAGRTFGKGTIERYAVEHGFLFALTRFTDMPKKYRWPENDPDDLVWVAGVDLHKRGEL